MCEVKICPINCNPISVLFPDPYLEYAHGQTRSDAWPRLVRHTNRGNRGPYVWMIVVLWCKFPEYCSCMLPSCSSKLLCESSYIQVCRGYSKLLWIACRHTCLFLSYNFGPWRAQSQARIWGAASDASLDGQDCSEEDTEEEDDYDDPKKRSNAGGRKKVQVRD